MLRACLLFCLLSGVAFAEASAWRLSKVDYAFRPGLTRFEVLQNDEHGGRVRVVIDPRDEACPGGATYTVGWRIDGDVRRVAKGSNVLVSFEGGQNGGNKCPAAEPRSQAASESSGVYKLPWAPGGYNSFWRPGGHSFYIFPEGHSDQLGQWQVTVPTNAYQDHLWLSIEIDTSGASGGQFFNSVLLFDGEAANAPPLGPATTGNTGNAGPPPQSGGPGLEVGMNRYGGDYRNFDVPSGNAQECRSACEADGQCRVFTLVRAGVQGPNAKCWLKNSVSPATPDANCTSGVVRPVVGVPSQSMRTGAAPPGPPPPPGGGISRVPPPPARR